MMASSSAGAPTAAAMGGGFLALRATAVMCDVGVALEEAAAGAELPEHHAEGVDVDAGVAGVAVGDLGRDVAGLGEDDARDGVAAAVLPARRAEVDDLALAAVAHHHVLRRQIAVHDGERLARGVVPLVDVGERLGDRAMAIATASAQPKAWPIWMARARTSPRLRPSTCSTTA